VLNEVPSYGYDNTQAASYANDHASSFYNGSECTCYATDSCRSPTVRMTTVGWVPGTALPIRNDHAGEQKNQQNNDVFFFFLDFSLNNICAAIERICL
jgi:hypothetical protein